MRRWRVRVAFAGAAGCILLAGLAGTQVSPRPIAGRAATSELALLAAKSAVATRGFAARASELPGLAVLNAGGLAGVSSLSCPSDGNCAAVGAYTTASDEQQGYVADEVHGTWRRAIEVPGLATLDHGASIATQVSSVSCPSEGNCVAVGSYLPPTGYEVTFITDEVRDTWRPATRVPGLAAFNTFGDAALYSVSCASAGNCVAVGVAFVPATDNGQAFIVDEVHGTWRNAKEVPGLASLTGGAWSRALSVSCSSAGNCAVLGQYTPSGASMGTTQGFVADEVHGTWRPALELPGLAALNTAGSLVDLMIVSCASAGNCAAGGSYVDSYDRTHAFVADEADGAWQDASNIPGTGGYFQSGVWSLSCPSVGNCAAAGYGNFQGFVVTQERGTWQEATQVPGLAALATSGSGSLSISCRSTGNCSAVGYYATSSTNYQGFVAAQAGGTWQNAIEVPGLASLNTGDNAHADLVSCPRAGKCIIAGTYTDNTGHTQVFVTG